jgi:hypothetical protein
MVKVSREIAQFSPSRTRIYMPHATVVLTAHYLNFRQRNLALLSFRLSVSTELHFFMHVPLFCFWVVPSSFRDDKDER